MIIAQMHMPGYFLASVFFYSCFWFFSTLSRLPHHLAIITNQPAPTVGATCVEIFTVRHTNKLHDVIVNTFLTKFTNEVSP